MRAAMLALAVLAMFAAAVNGEQLYEDLPASVVQQRSILQASTAPAYYGGSTRTKGTATIYLLIRPKKGVTLDARKYGLAHFNARVKPTLRKFNKANPTAHLNFRATYISGPTTLTGPNQGWLTYSFTVDLGTVGAPYRAALRSELRSVLRKKSAYVRVTRGNIA